jgi:hypothetical protein
MKDVLKVVAAVLAAILGIALLAWAGFAVSVLLSGPKGQGDAIKTKNSAQNWTAAQARFEKQYQAVISADEKIAVAAETLASKPDDLTLQQTLAGIKSACISAVADYNAESRKFLSEDFKSADLPYQIDKSEPATDCK